MSRAREIAKLINTNNITVDTNNNIGIGSTIPVTKLNVTGIISATSYYGDGSTLVGISNTISAWHWVYF